MAYSLSNITLTFGLARQLDVDEFGRFALLFSVLVALTAAGRAIVGENVALADTTADDDRGALSTSLLLGLLGFLVVSATIRQLAWQSPWTFYVLLSFAVVPLQDAGRYVLISRHRLGTLLAADFVWVLAPLAVLLTDGTARTLSMTWTGGAAFSAILLWVAALGARSPSVTMAYRWVVSTAARWRRLAIEAGISAVVQHGTLFVIAATVGTTGVGGFRAAQMLFFPVNLLISTMTSLGLSAAREQQRQHPRRAERRARLAALTIVLLSVLTAVTVITVPLRYVSLLVGDSARFAVQLAIPIGVASVAKSITAAPMTLLRAAGELSVAIRLRMTLGPLVLVALAIGGTLNGVEGASWGLAAVAGAGTCVWEWTYRRRRTHFHREASERSDRDIGHRHPVGDRGAEHGDDE